jgi:thymidine phosphorylase
MDQPLGHAVGNALEIAEAHATLLGEGPADFTELVLAASAHLLARSDLGLDEAQGRARAEGTIGDGSAATVWDRWIRAQGGDPDLGSLPRAPVVRTVTAPRDGFVHRLGAIRVGVAALELGAGRRAKEDAIDHAVGIVCHKKRGDLVRPGEPLAEIHAARDDQADAAAAAVLGAYEFADDAPPEQPIVLDVLSS